MRIIQPLIPQELDAQQFIQTFSVKLQHLRIQSHISPPGFHHIQQHTSAQILLDISQPIGRNDKYLRDIQSLRPEMPAEINKKTILLPRGVANSYKTVGAVKDTIILTGRTGQRQSLQPVGAMPPMSLKQGY